LPRAFSVVKRQFTVALCWLRCCSQALPVASSRGQESADPSIGEITPTAQSPPCSANSRAWGCNGTPVSGSSAWLPREQTFGTRPPGCACSSCPRPPGLPRRRGSESIRLDWLQRQGVAHLGVQHAGAFVKTDHRAFRVVRVGIQIQDLFHAPDEVRRHL